MKVKTLKIVERKKQIKIFNSMITSLNPIVDSRHVLCESSINVSLIL